MAFTMHSHSGQFCPGHAKDQLEDIIKHAISVGYKTMALTEHMPRYEKRDLYPEELDEPEPFKILETRHEAYIVEAQRLQALYASQIHILIAFEGEFIRPSFTPLVKALNVPHCVDFFIGSVHHVHGIPIDYDQPKYDAAIAASSPSTEERLFEDYYDLQYEMLRSLEPKVVGHFDLIRLLSKTPGKDVRELPGVWMRIKRNLEVARDQGAWLECNSAALRKGLEEPYPERVIAEEWLKLGGKFTMSDDSHGIAQVATNYARALTYLESLGVEQVWTLRRNPHPGTEGEAKSKLEEVGVLLTEFREAFPKTES